MKRLKTKIIKVPIYLDRFKVVVVDVIDKPEYEAYLDFEKDLLVLYIKPDASAEIVAHEAVHICNYIFKACGVLLDTDNDEGQAYMTGWVVGQITKTLLSTQKR